MKEFIKNLYQKLQNTKVHLWSHIMALIGWVYFIFSFLITNCFDESWPLFFGMGILIVTYYILFPSLIFILIEHHFFKKFKIKWFFLIKDPFYNTLWLIGLIILFICIIITLIIFQTMFSLFI